MGTVWKSAKELMNSPIRWVDTRFSLQDAQAGRKMFDQGHVKDAVYLDLEKDLSDMTKTSGRHPLPDKETIQELFEAHGFEYENHIAIYDQGGMPFAARAYWLFCYAGFPHVKMVREGYEELVEFGFEVTTDTPSYRKSSLTLQWNESVFSTRQQVKNVSEGKPGVLLDARSAPRYRGEHEPIDSVAGHIPSARNLDWELLKEEGRFKEVLEVLPEIEAVVAKNEEITVYCGSGVTAAPLYAMLKEAGFPNVKLYVGSYSDWITQYPVERS
ncbi:MAG TPA: sulfurtransferase [Paenisporosarcina sp.]|nr:sulfurtransferase [Paenisporosarcina sp.]